MSNYLSDNDRSILRDIIGKRGWLRFLCGLHEMAHYELCEGFMKGTLKALAGHCKERLGEAAARQPQPPTEDGGGE